LDKKKRNLKVLEMIKMTLTSYSLCIYKKKFANFISNCILRTKLSRKSKKRAKLKVRMDIFLQGLTGLCSFYRKIRKLKKVLLKTHKIS
jgi:hypothetical protein